jgi:hypothetical protein
VTPELHIRSLRHRFRVPDASVGARLDRVASQRLPRVLEAHWARAAMGLGLRRESRVFLRRVRARLRVKSDSWEDAALTSAWAEAILTAIRRALPDGPTDDDTLRREPVLTDSVAIFASQQVAELHALRVLASRRPAAWWVASVLARRAPATVLEGWVADAPDWAASSIVDLLVQPGGSSMLSEAEADRLERKLVFALATELDRWQQGERDAFLETAFASNEPSQGRSRSHAGAGFVSDGADETSTHDAGPWRGSEARRRVLDLTARARLSVADFAPIRHLLTPSKPARSRLVLRLWMRTQRPAIALPSQRDLDALVAWLASSTLAQDGWRGDQPPASGQRDERVKPSATLGPPDAPHPPDARRIMRDEHADNNTSGTPDKRDAHSRELPSTEASRIGCAGLLFLLRPMVLGPWPAQWQGPALREAALALGWCVLDAVLAPLPTAARRAAFERERPTLLAFSGFAELPERLDIAPSKLVEQAEHERARLISLLPSLTPAPLGFEHLYGGQLGPAPDDPFHALACLVARFGRLRVGRHEADLWLPLRSVDVAIRKAGLDIDPGWVPWLGRTIRIHYEET